MYQIFITPIQWACPFSKQCVVKSHQCRTIVSGTKYVCDTFPWYQHRTCAKKYQKSICQVHVQYYNKRLQYILGVLLIKYLTLHLFKHIIIIIITLSEEPLSPALIDNPGVPLFLDQNLDFRVEFPNRDREDYSMAALETLTLTLFGVSDPVASTEKLPFKVSSNS